MLTQITLNDGSIKWLRERRIFFENNVNRTRLRPGDPLVFDDGLEVEPYIGILAGNAIWDIGAFSYSWSVLPSGIQIGRYCSIAGGLAVPRPRHPVEKVSTASFLYDKTFSIMQSHIADSGMPFANFQDNPQKPMPVIGHDVWIGDGCSLMPGVSIGDGAVIAARSVVTKNVERYSIVGGNPARVIKLRFPERVIEKMIKAQWWRYSFTAFNDLPLGDPDRFASMIIDASESLPIYAPERTKLYELKSLK